AKEEALRQVLGYPRQRLEVFESALPTLRVSRAEAGDHQLLDERRLPRRGREERSQVAGVDPEARESRARRGDVHLALAVQPLASLGAGDDDSEVLELAHEVR